MNLKDVKFFIGPISKNTVDTIIEFSEKENYTIGLIPTRRQIDYDGGYVNNWNTESFINYVSKHKKNLILERDHGGIGQGRNYDNGVISLYEDSKKFDIIHIDPWKKHNNFQDALNETAENIKFINRINNECLFEVGTEESIYHFDEYMINNMLYQLKNKLGDLFKNIAYCVIQSGTKLNETKNTGKFNINRLKGMIKICENFGVLSKEHNGDYLSIEDMKIRFDAGLSAINIAPEFGVFETDILLEHMTKEQKHRFFTLCHNSNKWVKWVNDNFDPYKNENELIRICGHYLFSSEEFIKLNPNIDEIVKEKLYAKLKKMCEIL